MTSDDITWLVFQSYKREHTAYKHNYSLHLVQFPLRHSTPPKHLFNLEISKPINKLEQSADGCWLDLLTSLYMRCNTLVSRGSALLIPWSRVVGKCFPASRPLVLMCSAFSIRLPLYSTASVITPAAWDKP